MIFSDLERLPVMVFRQGSKGTQSPLAGCKGGALRLIRGGEGDHPGDDSATPERVGRAQACRGRSPCRGIQGGGAPLASLAKAEKPKGFFAEAVRCGLPQCETCLNAQSRFGSLGGRRRALGGLAIYPALGGRVNCLP